MKKMIYASRVGLGKKTENLEIIGSSIRGAVLRFESRTAVHRSDVRSRVKTKQKIGTAVHCMETVSAGSSEN